MPRTKKKRGGNRKKRKTRKGKGKGVGKNLVGFKVIEWLNIHANAMATVNLPADATPFMKAFKVEFKKI